MPSCIMVVNDISLFSPGFRVVEPTTGWNGQHPSRVLTWTSSICSVASPVFAKEKA